jgi:hypothetical protein
MITQDQVEKLLSGKKFPRTLTQKHGNSGGKGEKGEEFFKNYCESKGLKTILFEDHINAQTQGIDAVVVDKNGLMYSYDVKNNIDKDDQIVVEFKDNGWLFNPVKTSDYIAHVNVHKKIIVSYKRKDMKDFIIDNFWDYRSDLIRFNKNEIANFSKWIYVK